MKLKRIIAEERADVFRWFENDDVVGSLVQSDIPEEAELRITKGWKSGRPKIIGGSRGSKELFLKMPDENLIRKIENIIESEKWRT